MSLTVEQQAMRRTGVTATDSVVIAGEPYFGRTSLNVYNEKIGAAPAWEGSVATRAGDHNEAFIMELLAEEYSLTLTQGTTERHSILDYILATPDRNVVDKNGSRIAVAEAKFVGYRQAFRWDGGPPEAVIVQVTKQMIVTGQRIGYVAALLGTEPQFHVLEFHDSLASGLLEMDESFWKGNVLPRVPPPPEATEEAGKALRDLYPKVKGDMLRASPDIEEAAREYFAAKRELEAMETRKLAAENGLKAAIGDAAGIVGDGWRAKWSDRRGSVSWKNAVEALMPSVDKKTFEQFRGAGTRVFNCDPTEG